MNIDELRKLGERHTGRFTTARNAWEALLDVVEAAERFDFRHPFSVGGKVNVAAVDLTELRQALTRLKNIDQESA